MIKKKNLAVFFLLVASLANAQKKPEKEQLFVFDEHMKGTSIENAKYLLYVKRENDTTYFWNYYHFKGPLINQFTFKNMNGDIPHGYCAWFDATGKIDSAGETFNSLKHNEWYFFDDTLNIKRVDVYEMGKLVDSRFPEKKADSAIKILPGEKEAVFRGGDQAWRKYLEKNYQPPERAFSLGIGGTVMIQFVVLSTGKLADLKILKSVEYSIDREAIRLISQGPDWEPAWQDGRRVRAYRRQPITIQVQ